MGRRQTVRSSHGGGLLLESSKSASMSDLRDELADLMMRAVHTSYELTPTSPWIKVTEAIHVLISEALARHFARSTVGSTRVLLVPTAES